MQAYGTVDVGDAQSRIGFFEGLFHRVVFALFDREHVEIRSIYVGRLIFIVRFVPISHFSSEHIRGALFRRSDDRMFRPRARTDIHSVPLAGYVIFIIVLGFGRRLLFVPRISAVFCSVVASAVSRLLSASFILSASGSFSRPDRIFGRRSVAVRFVGRAFRASADCKN